MCELFSSQRGLRGARSICLASRAATLYATLSALMVFVTLVTSTTGSRADSQFEQTLNTALETLSSGVSATAMLGNTEVIVTPLRTWKSISGHYCRRFQVTSTKPVSVGLSTELTRCREGGIWKPVVEG